MSEAIAIHIPISSSDSDYVEIFPDELPIGDLDYNDLMGVLRAELAPLKIWRACAVSFINIVLFIINYHDISLQMEYHRQGYNTEFDTVLGEIVELVIMMSVTYHIL